MREALVPYILDVCSVWRNTYQYEELALEPCNPFGPQLKVQLETLFSVLSEWLLCLFCIADDKELNDQLRTNESFCKGVQRLEQMVHVEASRVSQFKHQKVLEEIRPSQVQLIDRFEKVESSQGEGLSAMTISRAHVKSPGTSYQFEPCQDRS